MQLRSSLTSNVLLSAGAAAAATGCALLLGASMYRRWRFWSAWTRIDELQVLRDNRVGRPVLVVTGAGGFLGRSVVSEALRRAPEMDVVAVDIAFSEAVLSDGGLSGVTFIKADVRSAEQCERALRGAVCVIHTAGLVPGAGVRMPERLWQVNVEGTKNILEASMKLGVASLVYTSSASVVVPAGTRQLEMKEVTAGEATTDKPFDAYALSKLTAERLVLDCCSNSMRTAVMRPGGMFGKGDRFLVDICGKGKATTVGRGDNFIPYIWVADAAAAHVQAATTLLKKGQAGKQLAGKALFLTNDHATDRITYYELYGGSPLSSAPGDSAPGEGLWPAGPPDRIPFWLAYSLAAVNDFLQGCFDLRLLPSAMTTSQMLWSQVCWGFSTAATRQLLPGWKPTPVREALAKLAGQAASS